MRQLCLLSVTVSANSGKAAVVEEEEAKVNQLVSPHLVSGSAKKEKKYKTKKKKTKQTENNLQVEQILERKKTPPIPHFSQDLSS